MNRNLLAAALLAMTVAPAFAMGANRNAIVLVETSGPRFEEAKALCKRAGPNVKDCVQAKLVARDVLALARALVPHPRARQHP
ncbi:MULTISPECIES: hypothetical protein [unclassified Variovorax]|uniref:hypothetical protein n=1 Tax=unclassified Variovorax TaxID=663243 RepID=UPI0011AFC305|nr:MULTISPECIES: hypothetical protein [unclassified Variovorax]